MHELQYICQDKICLIFLAVFLLTLNFDSAFRIAFNWKSKDGVIVNNLFLLHFKRAAFIDNFWKSFQWHLEQVFQWIMTFSISVESKFRCFILEIREILINAPDTKSFFINRFRSDLIEENTMCAVKIIDAKGRR